MISLCVPMPIYNQKNTFYIFRFLPALNPRTNLNSRIPRFARLTDSFVNLAVLNRQLRGDSKPQNQADPIAVA
jgi:hypothetical protein